MNTKRKFLTHGLSLLAASVTLVGVTATASAAEWPDRTVLPIAPFQKVGKLAPTIKDSDPIKWPVEVSAPKGAPNVLLIMMDDVGFGATDLFRRGDSHSRV